MAVVVGADDLDQAVELETVEELLDDLGRVVERELAVRSERLGAAQELAVAAA